MKKTVVILALALGFSITNLNASNNLLTSTSEVAVKTVEISPLCKAVATGDLDLAKSLIEQGADVNAKSNGMSPIHYAAKYNRVELIKVLLKAGADVHKSCDLGYTALNHAEQSEAKEAAQFLKRFKKKASN
ncbi:ankyrin repeat domain-containing protein [Winogradskyella sp.]|uniref:ankyrin repeat domain-containing protein n=1 Tax=Winogradskyella sp. TaxID=1883156 RepID=UPI002618721E|nr:ankyrin repeat domain-containing protein [uncultured Winogradskyella sp.]